jgi:hypothetical protein
MSPRCAQRVVFASNFSNRNSLDLSKIYSFYDFYGAFQANASSLPFIFANGPFSGISGLKRGKNPAIMMKMLWGSGFIVPRLWC